MVAQRLWDDWVLRSTCLVVGLLLAYQLAVTLLQPAWIGPATDWLQVLVAWSGLLVVVRVSHWLTRHHSHLALSWWLVGAGLLFYALARTLWLVEDRFLFPAHVPLPALPDLFFLLQYPCFLLALLVVPRVRPGIRRALLVVDTCLVIGAALALSWYFLLAPIFLSSDESPLGKLVNLGYPVGDLALVFGQTVILLRYSEYALDRAVTALLIAAFVCLVVADSWNALLLLNTSSYQTGSPPDLFWLAFYLLVPLAALVRLRLMQHESAGVNARQMRQPPTNLRRQDLLASLRMTFPVAAALLASVVLLLGGEAGDPPSVPTSPAPLLVALGLVVLALVRQALIVMEIERLRREREAALRETNVYMETFLGVAGHELKNPLASMQIGLQLVERRMRRLLQRERVEGTDVAPLLELVEQAERQEERMDQLVNDLVDVARVQVGRLTLHLAPTDLTAIVRETVEEQRQVHPERTILLECPKEHLVPVLADALRLGQVVTNYLTNALKYTPADRPVTVGLRVQDQQAQVWVRDEGPGLPPEEQERIWERFHRAPGITVLSGSGVGLGLGLHISRTIIELHHGQVGVQSTSGAGSTFWFTVPLATPAPAQAGSQADAPESSPRGSGQRS